MCMSALSARTPPRQKRASDHTVGDYEPHSCWGLNSRSGRANRALNPKLSLQP